MPATVTGGRGGRMARGRDRDVGKFLRARPRPGAHCVGCPIKARHVPAGAMGLGGSEEKVWVCGASTTNVSMSAEAQKRP